MSNWEQVGKQFLLRELQFDDFVSALEFLNRAAEICEQQNHHAEFTLGYGSLTIKTWSHDSGCITERDFKLANAIEELV